MNLGPSAAINGAGTVQVGTQVNAGSVQGTGNLLVGSGSLGTLNLTDTANDSHIGGLTVDYGNLSGAATLHVTGSFHWGNHATLAGPGTTVKIGRAHGWTPATQ